MYLRLLRHAKSDWSDPQLSDRQRPLNKRGLKAAPAMGRALRGSIDVPTVYVSPARRAQMTLSGLRETWPELGHSGEVTDESIYTFSARELVVWLQAQSGGGDLFLIGHNPAFTDLANWCCGRHEIDNLPTAGFVEMQLSLEKWSKLTRGCAGLVRTLFPKDLEHD